MMNKSTKSAVAFVLVAAAVASSNPENIDDREFDASVTEGRRLRGGISGFFESEIKLERTVFKLPEAYQPNLVDWNEPLHQGNETHPKATPIFWHILKSGGTHLKLMYATCYRYVEACETGEIMAGEEDYVLRHQLDMELDLIEEKADYLEWLTFDKFDEPENIEEYRLNWRDETEEPLEIQNWRDAVNWRDVAQQDLQQEERAETTFNGGGRRLQQEQYGPDLLPALRIVEADDGRRYVDVDVTTVDGIQRASERGLVPSGFVDVIFSPLIHESTEFLFDEYTKGRMFALFRHPVQRVTSLFHYLKRATHEPTYHERYESMTIEEYVNSPYVESNWMVRTLVGKMKGPISIMDVELAKDILERKCVVGLLHRFEESIDRFHAFFGDGDESALRCAKSRFVRRNELSNRNSHEHLDRNSELYKFLMEKNAYDVELFRFAKNLFEVQGEHLLGINS